MISVKEVLQKAGELIGGFPLTATRIEAAGFDATEFLSSLIDKLQKCPDAKDHKLVQALIQYKKEFENIQVEYQKAK